MFRLIRNTIGFTIKLILLIAVICGGIFVYARLVEPYTLEISEVKLDTPSSLTCEELNIVLFGDTHLGFDYDIEHLYKVIDEINSLEPDMIIFTGDLIDDLNTYTDDTSEVSFALSLLNSKYGNFAVHGNHDYEMSAEDPYTDIMENGGFDVLINESIYIPELNMEIYGITDCLIGSGDTSILKTASGETYNLVLCHEPDIFDQLNDYSVTLMLAGHSHGGQVKIPFYTEKFLPKYGSKYVYGLFTSGGQASDDGKSLPNTLYVTKGIGTTQLPLRFMAKPEIVSISLSR